MSGWLNMALWVLAALLLVPVVIVCIECLAALLPASGRNRKSVRPRVGVLVPAHNEEAGLADTLATLTPQLQPSDRLLVVADNCTDQTAAVARQHGADVFERRDTARRGKGYALDAGMRRLEQGPAPEVVVIIDADCRVSAGAIDALAGQVEATGSPAQAVYLMAPAPDAGGGSAVSSLAFLVKNHVRPRGLARLGMPCLLTGTGMAFPWETLRQAKLASGNIVEDMQLGIDLALERKYPTLCDAARVDGQLPTREKAALTQRTRWEHGHLRTLAVQAPRLLLAGVTRFDIRLLALGLELAVPPLSLLTLGLVSAAGVSSLLALLVRGIGWAPAVALATGLAVLIACIFAAWWRFGRQTIRASALARAPLYLAWKLPLYFAFIRRREKDWVRTERDAAPSGAATGSPSATGRPGTAMKPGIQKL